MLLQLEETGKEGGGGRCGKGQRTRDRFTWAVLWKNRPRELDGNAEGPSPPLKNWWDWHASSPCPFLPRALCGQTRCWRWISGRIVHDGAARGASLPPGGRRLLLYDKAREAAVFVSHWRHCPFPCQRSSSTSSLGLWRWRAKLLVAVTALEANASLSF